MGQSPPPSSGYDVEAVVAAARAKDPSIDPKVGRELAVICGRHVADGTYDPADVARRVLAEHPEADASWANHIARAAVEHVVAGLGG